MNTEIITNIIGYAGSICLVLGYLPQAIYTIRTRKTDGIAIPTFLLMGFGSLFFALQGALMGNWPLILCNSITCICSAIIFGIKMRNDWRRRKEKRAASSQSSAKAKGK